MVADITEFRRRRAETIAWCSLDVAKVDLKDSLRTPALQPVELDTDPSEWGELAHKQASVSALADRRAELLHAANAYTDIVPPDLAGGRLLIAAPEDSDQCGFSGPETDGFIDELDVPAWDTWISYLHEETTPEDEQVRITQAAYRAYWNKPEYEEFEEWQPPASVSYLLCWIPPPFLAMMEDGIKMNPADCLFWAADYRQHHYNTPFLRELDAAGLLT